jgi:hypothetical protein
MKLVTEINHTLERPHRINGRERAVMTDTTASKIHRPHAKYRAHSPHAGTQTRQNILIIVASPMGNVPMNMDCTGCLIIARKISGYKVYRRIEMILPVINRSTFSPKITTEIQYSQIPL